MAHNVIIYSTPTCGYCKIAKAFFKEHNVEFVEKDVSVDAAAREEFFKKSKGQNSVPIIDVDGTIVIGFDKAKLSQLLGLV